MARLQNLEAAKATLASDLAEAKKGATNTLFQAAHLA
jgi:hypothetical protein